MTAPRAVTVAGVILVLLASWLVVQLRVPPLDILFGVFLVLTLVLPLVWLLAKRARAGFLDVLSPVGLVPVTFGIVFAGAPNLLVSSGDDETAGIVVASLSGAILCYYAGVFGVRLLASGAPRLARHPSPVVHGPRDSRWIYVAFCVGCVAMMIYWAQDHGIPILKGDLENSRVAALSGNGVPFYFSMFLMIAVWLSLAPGSGIGRRPQAVMLLLGAGLLASTGWRNTVFALVVVAVLLVQYIKPFKTRTIVLVGSLTVIVAAGIGMLRVVSSNLVNYQSFQLLQSGNVAGAFANYLATYADAFGENLATVFAVVPANLPFQHGKTLIWNFISLIPGHKLQPFDFVLKQASGQGFEGGGLPATMVGELYLNFGWMGIVFGMVAIGALSQVAYSVLRRSTYYHRRLIAVIVIYYIFVAVRGGIGDVTLTVVWLILGTLVVNALSQSRSAYAHGLNASASLS